MSTTVPVDLRERMEVLFWQETTSYKVDDYLSAFRNTRQGEANVVGATTNGQNESSSTTTTTNMTSPPSFFGIGDEVTSPGDQQIKEHWREIICEWAYNLVDHFDLPRERVSVFTNILDRYLQKYLVEHPEGITKKHFQLLSLTCLYLTIKLDCHQGFLSMEMMIHLSREKFSKYQMSAMEKEILRCLEWKLHPPTPSIFLRHFLLLLQPQHRVHRDVIESARFYMELAALDYQSVTQRPSRIALAALLNAMEQDRAVSTLSGCAAEIRDGHFHFLFSLIDPTERETVNQCRCRLMELFHGLAADDDDMDVLDGAHGAGRMASPVSVAHGHPLA
ncbi:diatom-specific cyclin [Seminavis robusta]|uniref:Diatom-specific cyclin n=1 Tax=Seminavis robusta TaxID=568900 RepID=A0A9N8EBF8_9STRA|nr:diatom-specific cyclin [Seminavis robusta]|eukprot:Sro718_g192230.1 diatom-specific cyclin (334) ;mRNA; r:44175-45262